jgi:DNA-binding transcriptional ArsR family regulator
MTASRAGHRTRRWRGTHRALADPLRIQLLEALWERPRSARELAHCTGLPADRLYYHLAQLQEAGLIEISEYRQMPRGKVERVYAPAVIEPPADATTPQEMVAFLGSMLDATRADIAAAYRAKEAGRRREVTLHRGAVRLTDEDLSHLHGEFEELAEQFGDREADGKWTRVLIAMVDLEDRDDTSAEPSTDDRDERHYNHPRPPEDKDTPDANQ